MRTDLAARRYASVIAEANALLESARAITTPQRIELWQLLAAAYYPNAADAQQSDSARLPLGALIRLAPDFRMARELSWTGLDVLTERTRAEMFAVLTRPEAEYRLGAPDGASGRIAVVASRPARFRLTSVSGAGGRTAFHDSAEAVMSAALELHTHDRRGPIFTAGVHRLEVWAYDLASGDSVRLTHRVRATEGDLPPPVADFTVPSPPEVPRIATRSPATHRSALLWGGLALAGATALIAQEARPDDTIRSAFRVDARAFIVGAVMAAASVANFIGDRRPPPTETTEIVTSPPPPQAQVLDTYWVRLQIDPPER